MRGEIHLPYFLNELPACLLHHEEFLSEHLPDCLALERIASTTKNHDFANAVASVRWRTVAPPLRAVRFAPLEYLQFVALE